MSEGPYRKGERVPTRQCVEAEAAIGRCDATMGPLSLTFVPVVLRERIERLRRAGEGADDDVRISLAEALEEALSIVKDREADLRDLPMVHPDAPSFDDVWGPTGTEVAAAPVVEEVRALVQRSDRSAEVTRTGACIVATFASRGTPIVWSVHLGAGLSLRTGGDVHAFATSSHWLGTSVPDGIPRLFLRMGTLSDAVLKALHLRTEVEVGDDVFDEAFFVEGEKDLTRELLTNELRDAFLEQAHFGEFTFLLEGSTASLVWKGSLPFGLVPEGPLVSSVKVLCALRASLGRLRLLRSG